MASVFSIPQSPVIKGLQWCGDRIPYPEPDIKGDTFPMTWADDGEIYAATGDPCWGETKDGLELEDWVYGTPPGRIVFVTFNGDKVIKVKESYAGLGTQVADPPVVR